MVIKEMLADTYYKKSPIPQQPFGLFARYCW
jgi:hypothetical protein